MEEFLVEETVGEQKVKAAVLIGRLNPPTVGHYKGINLMKAFIRENPDLELSATPVVVIVEGEKTSLDKKKNPLTGEERVKFIAGSGKANGVKFLIANSGFGAFEAVRKAGFEPIAIAAGSDRIDSYMKILNKYFKARDGSDIKHVKIPGLDREGQDGGTKEKTGAMKAALEKFHGGDDLHDSEVSGSMARRAVALGYKEEFAKIVGLEHKPKLAQLMFNKIKASMGNEEEENG